ncbi:MAG: hypothetical protein [Bacteriophage sp.]|nr:MAG: hypothetical protein [Bacteriophage sp.]
MLKDYLDEKLGRGKSAEKDTIYVCPFCGRQKLYVMTDHSDDMFGVYNCFHCNASGSLTKLVSSIENISYAQARLKLPEIDKYAVTVNTVAVEDATPEESLLAVMLKSQEQKPKIEDKTVDLTKIPEPDKLPAELPLGLKYFEDNAESDEIRPFTEYLYSRGISWQDIVYYHMGYIINGGAFSKNNTMFPIHNHVVFFCYNKQGYYQYWNTRAIYPSVPKSINAPEIADHFGKGDVVFNLYPALEYRYVVLVEGVPDALTLGQNAIATYGKKLTDTQKALIINNIKPEQNLMLMLDMDAWATMSALAIELYKYHENTYIVYNQTRKDANSLGYAKAWEVINTSNIKATPKGVSLFELWANMY